MKRAIKYLAVVIAVLMGWTVAGTPSSFATDPMSSALNAVQITPAISKRAVTQNQELFFDKVFTFATANDKGIISSTPDSLDKAHVDGDIDAKVTRLDGTEKAFIRNYEFQLASSTIDPSGPLRPGANTIRIGPHGAFGAFSSSSALWLVSGKTDSTTQHVTCPESASALLRPVLPNSPVPKPGELRVTLHYGKLALRFKSAPKPGDSFCTLVSQRGALPVITDFKVGPGAGLANASQQVAASVTTATLDVIRTRTDIRRCDFSLMKSLSRPVLADSTKPLPSGTNKCYLNELDSGATTGLTVRWSIPGFEEYTPDERGVRVYKTRALTYYTDLNSLLETGDVSLIDSAVIDYLENYIHQTLIKNLPAITPVGLTHLVFGT